MVMQEAMTVHGIQSCDACTDLSTSRGAATDLTSCRVLGSYLDFVFSLSISIPQPSQL